MGLNWQTGHKEANPMIKELTAEDFARGIKNPYFDKLMKKTEVAVEHEFYDVFYKIGKQNGVSAEMIMSRCLADYAMELQVQDDET